MYRAAMFIVEDAIMNPTNPTHKGPIAWKDLSPFASECLQSHVNLLPLLEQGKDLPRDWERDQSCKHPGWSAEQECNSRVIAKCSSEGGEEDAKRDRDDDAGDTSCSRQIKRAPGI